MSSDGTAIMRAVAKGAYSGPVCYIGFDHESEDGRPLEGGNFYSTVPTATGEMPGEKLTLDPDKGTYSFAVDGDPSWKDSQHAQLKIIAPSGNIGEPKTAEEIEAAHRHLDELLERLGNEGLHPHESDHLLSTPIEISAAKKWLNTLPGAKA